MKNLKVVFMGTPEFAVSVLEKLIENTNVCMVVTQPDARVGRKKLLTPSPVKQKALEHNIKVFTPNKIKEDYQEIIDINPDIIITCAYGQIIPKVLLETPIHKCINVHASLLPKYRGGSPISKCLIDGESETGITIMYMDEGMDDGDIITKKSLKIEPLDNIHTLLNKLSEMGANLLIETLPSILNKTCQRIKQNEEEVTFAFVPKREDELLDFNDTAINLHNKVRGLSPFTYCLLDNQEMKIITTEVIEKDYSGRNGEIVDVDKISFYVKCRENTLRVLEVKPFSKKQMKVKDYFNGVKKEVLKGKYLNEKEK